MDDSTVSLDGLITPMDDSTVPMDDSNVGAVESNSAVDHSTTAGDDSNVAFSSPDAATHFRNAEHSYARFLIESEETDLQKAIESYRCAYDLVRHEDHALRIRVQAELAIVLRIRAGETGHYNDLHESISLAKDAVNRSVGADVEDRARCLRALGQSLVTWGDQKSHEAGNAFEDAITLLHEAVLLTEGRVCDERIACLIGYGRSLMHAHREREGDVRSALAALNKAMMLASKGHYLWMEASRWTGLALRFMFQATFEQMHLDMAINMVAKCIDTMPVHHYGCQLLRNSLAVHLSLRYDHFGQSSDLDRSIDLLGQLAADTPNNHADWPMYQGNYLEAIYTRYVARSQLQDLDLAVDGFRNIVNQFPLGDEYTNYYTIFLCRVLQEAFTQYGRTCLLDEAIEIQQRAVRAIKDIDNWRCHKALGTSHLSRFRAFGYMRDLDKAVAQLEQARTSCLIETARAGIIADLGDALSTRFYSTRDPNDINKAIHAFEYALEHSDEQNFPVVGRYQSWLGFALLQRFSFAQNDEDLLSAIAVLTKAVKVLPTEHTLCSVAFSTLGVAQTQQFELSSSADSIKAAVEAFDTAVSLTPKGRPARAQYASQLGEALYALSVHSPSAGDVSTALGCLKDAAEDEFSFIAGRFQAANRWSTLAYDSGFLPLALQGYRLAVELLPQIAWLGLEHDLRLKRLSAQSHNICQNGAACAIALGKLEVAVEILDRGRSVIWNASQDFRIDLAELQGKHPDLARTFQEVGLALDYRALSSEHSSERRSQLSQEHDGQHHRRLANQWQELLNKIRKQEGFEQFLKPANFSQLRGAARGGVVVLLNLSEYRCDALLVTENLPIHLVPLPKVNLSSARQQAYVLAAARHVARDSRGRQFLEAVLLMTLRSLWDAIGEPVWDVIKTLAPNDRSPRVWWCPTGALAQLPLHACGPFDDEHPGMADLVISSYTPTLSALLRAKKSPTSSELSPSAARFSMLGIGQSNTPGQPALPCANAEMDVLRSTSFPEPVTIIEGNEATVDRIRDLMTKHGWLHVATHGAQRANAPLESCLHLFDGPLRLSAMAQANLPNAIFAFLSACHSAKGDESLPDESLHLAGGLLFAGYKGVLATQWSIADRDAPIVARIFYRHLTRDGKVPDADEAAEALHIAVRALREASVPAFRWVPFVHLGL